MIKVVCFSPSRKSELKSCIPSMPSEIRDLVMKAFKIGNLKREKKAPTGIRIISVAWQSASCPWCLSVRHRMPSLYIFLISLGTSEILSRTICQQLKTSNGRMIKFSGSGMERLSSVGDCHCQRKFGELAKMQRAHFIGKAHFLLVTCRVIAQ